MKNHLKRKYRDDKKLFDVIEKKRFPYIVYKRNKNLDKVVQGLKSSNYNCEKEKKEEEAKRNKELENEVENLEKIFKRISKNAFRE